jgi:hypothetical protein
MNGFHYIYQVINTSSHAYYMYQEQINEIIGDQEWLNSDMNYLFNLAANRWLPLSTGTKKGDTKRELISTIGYGIGNLVGLKNHGDKWDQKAHLMLVDFENKFASVKLEATRKINNISIFDLYELEDIRTKTRKQKQTDFLYLDNKKNNNARSMVRKNEGPPPGRNGTDNLTQDNNKKYKVRSGPPPGHIENHFYSEGNELKFCAEGSLHTLMSMMHYADALLDLFWTLATSPIHTVMAELGQKCVPKNVLKKGYNSVDSLEKSLWILRLRFKFSFTSSLRTQYFAKVNDSVWILSLLKFPKVISVGSKLALNMHVVVIWRGRVID